MLTTANEFVVAAVRKVLYIWDSQTGSLIKTLDEHFARITALLSISSRDVNYVISVSLDKTVKARLIASLIRRVQCLYSMVQTPLHSTPYRCLLRPTVRHSVSVNI